MEKVVQVLFEEIERLKMQLKEDEENDDLIAQLKVYRFAIKYLIERQSHLRTKMLDENEGIK